ncbi:hypothetical protein GCM10007916_28850 [Psychromonas marina]|uniref:DUF2125 domain-containing protein n=1 Tax=Psychromonas marina TaxID=88364 RepID=A0ABQ6E3Q6_9GAMM|nr:hypothetical protein [Psychromonas marina]GLS91815.1 hypothetical protein GCM10007916_28850 [Psychromonas marina]
MFYKFFKKYMLLSVLLFVFIVVAIITWVVFYFIYLQPEEPQVPIENQREIMIERALNEVNSAVEFGNIVMANEVVRRISYTGGEAFLFGQFKGGKCDFTRCKLHFSLFEYPTSAALVEIKLFFSGFSDLTVNHLGQSKELTVDFSWFQLTDKQNDISETELLLTDKNTMLDKYTDLYAITENNMRSIFSVSDLKKSTIVSTRDVLIPKNIKNIEKLDFVVITESLVALPIIYESLVDIFATEKFSVTSFSLENKKITLSIRLLVKGS